MGTKISLTVPDDVYAEVEKIAASSQRDVADIMLETITRSFSPIPIDPRWSQMEQEIQAYKAMHDELVKSYLGQYVAIHHQKLVDHDSNPVALLKRVKANFPQKVVLRRKVEPIAETVLHIRRPKIIKNE